MRKENLHPSQNESMLVSERKTFELFAKNNKCICYEALKNIEGKLEMFALKLDEVTATVNICFAKHMESYSKLIEEQKSRENVEFVVWELKKDTEVTCQNISAQVVKQKESMQEVMEEVQGWSRMLRELKAWRGNFDVWSAGIEQKFTDDFKKHKQQNKQIVRTIYSAVQQIGVLQRKMLEKHEPNNEKRARVVSYNQRPSLPNRKSFKLNQSTALYASRN